MLVLFAFAVCYHSSE